MSDFFNMKKIFLKSESSCSKIFEKIMTAFIKTKDWSWDTLTRGIIGAAFEVHRLLGPGLLEAAYETCLASELLHQGLKVERQKLFPVFYKDLKVNMGYRLDLFVDEKVIIEVKSVQFVGSIHKAQLFSYLKLTGCRVGLLLNFNVISFKEGIYRVSYP